MNQGKSDQDTFGTVPFSEVPGKTVHWGTKYESLWLALVDLKEGQALKVPRGDCDIQTLRSQINSLMQRSRYRSFRVRSRTVIDAIYLWKELRVQTK